MNKSFLEHLEWRSAEKNFDPAKKVSEEGLNKVLEAVRFTPTSFGLQPFHVYVVTDEAVRGKIREASWGQAQVTDASHLLVFASRLGINDRIESYFQLASGGDAAVRESMKGYEDMMRGFAGGMTPEREKHWADKQAYIALGFALAACAELEIDSCPMEGFDPSAVDALLGLPENMKSVVMLPIGYRNDMPHYPKVRFGADDLFTIA